MQRRLAASLTCLLWGFWTYTGYNLTVANVQRHVPGYPTAGQWRYYVYFPLAMLLINVGLLLFARKLPTKLFVTALALQIVPFIPFFLGYTGGV